MGCICCFTRVAPSLPKLIEFGNNNDICDGSFVDLKRLENPPDKSVKIKAIQYKVEPRGWLCGIQLEFTTGESTQMFETEHEAPLDLEVQRAELDISKTIRKISLKMYKKDHICGIRIIDSDGNPML